MTKRKPRTALLQGKTTPAIKAEVKRLCKRLIWTESVLVEEAVVQFISARTNN